MALAGRNFSEIRTLLRYAGRLPLYKYNQIEYSSSKLWKAILLREFLSNSKMTII